MQPALHLVARAEARLPRLRHVVLLPMLAQRLPSPLNAAGSAALAAGMGSYAATTSTRAA